MQRALGLFNSSAANGTGDDRSVRRWGIDSISRPTTAPPPPSGLSSTASLGGGSDTDQSSVKPGQVLSEETLERIIEAVEERVIEELERRGVRYDPGVF